MTDAAKLTRAIRINIIGGTVILAVSVFTVVLVAVGILPLDTQAVVVITVGFVFAGLSFVTARSLPQDRDDPAGIERRFQSGALLWSAGLLAVGLVAVVSVIAWGVLR